MKNISLLKIVATLSLLVAAHLSVAQSAATESLGLPGADGWAYVPGSEYPGAKGEVGSKTEDGVFAKVLRYDFTNGGLYVGARSRVNIPAGATEIRVRVKSDEGGLVSLRLQDADDKVFPILSSYVQAGEWQTLRFPLTGKLKAFGGGTEIRYPIKALAFNVHKADRNKLDGEVSFTRFEIIE